MYGGIANFIEQFETIRDFVKYDYPFPFPTDRQIYPRRPDCQGRLKGACLALTECPPLAFGGLSVWKEQGAVNHRLEQGSPPRKGEP